MGSILDSLNAESEAQFEQRDIDRQKQIEENLAKLNAQLQQDSIDAQKKIVPTTLTEAFLKPPTELGADQDLSVVEETLNPGTNYKKAKKEAGLAFGKHISHKVVGHLSQFQNPERKNTKSTKHLDLYTWSTNHIPDAVEMGNLKQVFLQNTLKHMNPSRYHAGQNIPILGALFYNQEQGIDAAKSHVPWVEERFESMNTYIKSVNKVRAFEGHEPIALFDKDEVMTYYLDMVQNNASAKSKIKDANSRGKTGKADLLKGSRLSMNDLYANFIPRNELGSKFRGQSGRGVQDNWFNKGHGSEYGSVKHDYDVYSDAKTFNVNTVQNVDWLKKDEMIEDSRYNNFKLQDFSFWEDTWKNNAFK